MISVIVPHYENLAALDLCLSALDCQDLPRSAFEIVVADNMSPSGDAAVAATIAGRARLTIARDKGAGPARNAAVAAAAGDILAFTDADCVPKPGWLCAGVAALDNHDLVGGAMILSIDHDGALSGAEAFERVFAFDNRRYVEQLHFSVTANLFCRRATFDAVGPFRVGVSEDLEWCQRATARGYTIGYAERAIVAHPARRDWAALLGKWRRINAESYHLSRAQRWGRTRWAVRSLMLLPSIAAHAPRVLRQPALSGMERVRALGTLVRLRLWRFADAQRLWLGRR